jgi:hypothetical protein
MPARPGALLLAAFLLGGSRAAAQGEFFTRNGSGARAAGMGNAFMGISDDGTAASWNPSGLGQLRQPELSIVSTTAGRTQRAEGFRTRDDLSVFSPSHSSYRSSYLDFASLAVPLTLWGKPVTFQGSWRRLYTLDYRESFSITREPLDALAPPPLRIDVNSDLVGAVDVISVAGAVKLTPRLALGGGFNLWRGDWTEEDDVSETPLAGSGLTGSRRERQTNRVRGKSFNLGLMLTYPRWSVGVLYQGPLRCDFSATASITASGQAAVPPRSGEGTLLFPQAVGAGVAWHPAQRWTVAVDLTWDDWNEAALEGLDPEPISIFDGLPVSRTSTRDTISVNAGAERLVPGDGFVVPLRFGVAWEPQGGRSPYTRDPVDFVMLAAGTGYNTNSLKFDAAFHFRWAHFRDGADFGLTESLPLLPSAVGERDVKEWRLKLSLIVRVTDTDKLRRRLRRIFTGGS